MDLPQDTGVYFFYDKDDTLLYIGKAKNIAKRITQHKQDSIPWKKRITRIDFQLTESEEEALLLEQQLVNQLLPRYNVRLRDDKSYSYIAISYDEDFPRVYLTREKHKKSRRYFGPYINSKQGKRIVKTLSRIYPFRSCTGKTPGREKNPCLDWHLGFCGAPCVGYIDKKDYLENIKKIDDILSGKTTAIKKDLEKKMREASLAKEYEKAALWRDRLHDLEAISGKKESQDNYDALVFLENKVFLLPIREGRNQRGKIFVMENGASANLHEQRTAFLLQYYDNPPPEILLEEEIDPLTLEVFQKKFPTSKLKTPKRGARKKLLQRARQEALWKTSASPNEARRQESFQILGEKLGENIKRIETYDASNLGEESLYVSMVVFQESGAQKSHYRVFSLPEQKNIDDYKALESALKRRRAAFRKACDLKKSGEKYDPSFAEKPDIILIDGGKGQLNRAQKALRGFIEPENIFSLAKREETVFRLGEEVDWGSSVNLLFQEMRDEAHRFALKHNRRSRNIQDPLDKIPGIGKKRKALLSEALGDIDLATLDEIKAVPGIPSSLAEKIYTHFRER